MEASDVDPVIEISAGLAEAPRWPRAAWERVVSGEAPLRIALVAERDGAVVGFAVAALVAGQAEIESIAVNASAQRAGIGRGLMRDLTCQLERLGIQALMLEVRASNEAALRLYRGMGFTETGRRADYYAQPVEDAILMQLSPLAQE